MPVRMTLRAATVDDVPQILAFIRALADYERLLDQVVATEDGLRRRCSVRVRTPRSSWPRTPACRSASRCSSTRSRPSSASPGSTSKICSSCPRPAVAASGAPCWPISRGWRRQRGCGRVEWAVLDWNAAGDPLLREPRGPAQRRVDRLPPDRGSAAALAAIGRGTSGYLAFGAPPAVVDGNGTDRRPRDISRKHGAGLGPKALQL